MPESTKLQRLAALVGWGLLCSVAAFVAIRGLLIDETVATLGALALWGGGIAWWAGMRHRRNLRSSDTPRDGLTTGEMTAQRLEAMEARIYELEERLELTERLLAEARERPRLPQARERTLV
jgi:hypothetical protein